MQQNVLLGLQFATSVGVMPSSEALGVKGMFHKLNDTIGWHTQSIPALHQQTFDEGISEPLLTILRSHVKRYIFLTIHFPCCYKPAEMGFLNGSCGHKLSKEMRNDLDCSIPPY